MGFGEQIELAIATHKEDASAHHTKYTNAEAIAAAKTDTALKNPSGLIVLWHGTIASIPSGWVICDGNSSSPNLLTRFIEGVATAATNPGATGGAVSHKHTMGTHTHTNPQTGNNTTSPTASFEYRAAGGLARTHTHPQADTGAKDPGDTNYTDGRPKFYDVAFLMKT
ncbi:hypothetical protein ES708_00772 [subsurface metagenome]